ncbi:amino acid permease [Mucilaginibacter sp. dw_454]|uniref:APC family permease n=1 Tax=Mucilaginibacter sp. dw_454 TaxID=2720079 RepID=UPI001BD5485A|nr:amino acid permease [Mucilaginibacter sp. dw_454]
MTIIPKLTRFDLSMIVVSLVIGMGIFETPTQVALNVNNPYLYFGAWIFGGAISLCGALTFAEIGARYPTTGGFYKVLSYCFHPAFAFMINWIVVIGNAASVAAVALIGAEYLNPLLLPVNLQQSIGIKLISISSVLILFGNNLFGIKMSSRTQNVFTVFKIALITVLCCSIFSPHASLPKTLITTPLLKNNLKAFGMSLIAVFFTYGGYQQTINFGGDSINANRNIPKAIFTGMGIVISLYLLINFAYFRAWGIEGMRSVSTPAATLASSIFGEVGYKIISWLMFVSVIAFINVNIMSNPRVYYAMAEDGILPQKFKSVNEKTQVPIFGLSFFVLTVIFILLFVNSFQKILNYVMFFDTIGLSTAAASIFILRKKTKHLNNTGIYTIKWYPAIPILFIVAYWFVTLTIFIEKPMAALVCLCAFIIGLIIFFATKKTKKPIIPL